MPLLKLDMMQTLALANMESIVERFGPAPRAFLVVPRVGAFFIDFTNALIITIFISVAG